MESKIVHTDVLVIGGGQAALRAAIEARRKGASVIMVSKGKIGAGGSSAISDAVQSAILTPGDSSEVFYQDMLKGGKQINKVEIARALAEDCTKRVEELQHEFKVELYLDRDLITPGHSFPRRCYHKSGVGVAIVRELRKYAEDIGVSFYEKTTVVDLLSDLADSINEGASRGPVSSARIIGAVGMVDEACVVFAAGSTILATGGVGRIYAHSDNPNDVGGDGIGMAWRHGVELQDMEFVQFYPYRLISPLNMDLYTKLFGQGAIMRNEKGERFLEKFPRKELETRDIVCYQMYSQEKVLLDLSQVDEADLQAIVPRLHSRLEKGYTGELVMQPVEHYSIGGISIDANGRTNLKGLYACGECTGGVHGANRLGGGALTEALVFGTRAGLTAAEEAIAPQDRLVAEAARSVNGWNSPVGKEKAGDIRQKVQQIMWNKVGIERTESGLKEACSTLDAVLEETQGYQPLRDMVQVARIIARSAYARKESRGAHQLLDYPREREEWRGNLIIKGEAISFQGIEV